MKYWINRESSTDNIVVLAKTGILVASCEKEACSDIDQKLNSNTHPLSIFSKDDVKIIKFTQIFKIVSRNTDQDVEVHYREKKENEDVDLYFEDDKTRDSFLAILGKTLPENFNKSEYQQSLLTAIFPSLISIIAAIGISYFYINRWRWATIIVAGLWLLLAGSLLIKRMRTPPIVTQWSANRKAISKAYSGFKIGLSYVVASVVVIGLSEKLPLNYGDKAILDHLNHFELQADQVDALVRHGANPNLADEYGDRPLHTAIHLETHELVTALLEHGADPTLTNGEGQTALEYALSYGNDKTINSVISVTNNFSKHPHLLQAMAQGSPSTDIMAAFVAKGFDIQQRDQSGKNLLQLAVENYSEYEFIAYLVDQKLSQDFTVEDLDPIDYLREEGRLDVVNLFEGKQPNISSHRLKEIEAQLDELVVTIAKEESDQLLESADPKTKALIKAMTLLEDDVEEYDPSEYQDPIFEKAMIVKRNAVFFDVYNTQCENIGFDKSNTLSEELRSRSEKRKNFLLVADLLMERNQLIWLEEQQQLPMAFIEKESNKAEHLRSKFLDAALQQEMIEHCQAQLDRLQNI